MDGYLLDANHVIPLLRDQHKHRAAILGKLAGLSADAPVCIATATLAELEVGCCLQEQERVEAQTEIHQAIQANRLTILEFTKHTAAEYGALKAALMRKYNREHIKKAAKWPELWTSPDKGATLGVDEFDLLVVSHAVERRLVLATTDQMLRICGGVGDHAEDLRFDNWVPAAIA